MSITNYDGTVTYEGAVLDRWEHNGYDDSDFYAAVWDGSKVAKVMYDTTRFGGGGNAKVDATPEVEALAREWITDRIVERHIATANDAALRVYNGDIVRSLTTRGKACGAVGEVRWVGPDQFRSTRHHIYYRVGIKVDGQNKLVYVNMDRVALVAPKPVNVAQVEAQSRAWCDSRTVQSLACILFVH